MRFMSFLAAAMLVALAQFGSAVDARDQFDEKDVVRVDPQKSYIFFRARARMPRLGDSSGMSGGGSWWGCSSSVLRRTSGRT